MQAASSSAADFPPDTVAEEETPAKQPTHWGTPVITAAICASFLHSVGGNALVTTAGYALGASVVLGALLLPVMRALKAQQVHTHFHHPHYIHRISRRPRCSTSSWSVSGKKNNQIKFQVIRSDGPQSHLGKAGTPTMGGLALLVASLAASYYVAGATSSWVIVAAATVGMGLVGLLDDLLIIFRQSSGGIAAAPKLLLQLVVATITCYLTGVLLPYPPYDSMPLYDLLCLYLGPLFWALGEGRDICSSAVPLAFFFFDSHTHIYLQYADTFQHTQQRSRRGGDDCVRGQWNKPDGRPRRPRGVHGRHRLCRAGRHCRPRVP